MDTFGAAEEKLIHSLRIPIEAKDISILGHQVHYVVAGQGSPLILLHGGTFGWGMWYKNIPELAKKHTVYAIDLPGSGRSSSLDYPASDFETDFVEVIAAFIIALELKGNVTLVGHSFAGWIALRVSAKNPGMIKKLVLIDGTGLTAHATLPDLVISFAPFARFLSRGPLDPRRDNPRLVGFLHSAFAKKEVELSLEFIEYFYCAMRKSHNISFISELIRRRKKLCISDLNTISFPETLVVWGEKDTIVTMSQNTPVLKTVDNFLIEVIPDTGHVPPLEKPDILNSLLNNFA